MEKEAQTITPMLRQYFQMKKQYPDAILFFRMGDFYEMFFEDAKTAAPVLEVVLTSRNKSSSDSVPMCGVPHHAMENYAAKLLKKGFKVAICEQMEDPALAKGLVKREVTRILTPATALEIESGEAPLNNFILAVGTDEAGIAVASLDLAVSDFEVKFFPHQRREAMLNEFYRKHPQEIVISRSGEEEFGPLLRGFPEFENILVNTLDDEDFSRYSGEATLKSHFGVETLEGFGLQGHPAAVSAAGVLLTYLRRVRKTALTNISSLRFSADENYLVLDSVTFRNLEIITNLRTGTGRGTLFEAVDTTITPMGKRLLKRWLSYPLLDRGEIERRLDGVEEFSQNLISRSETRRLLKHFGDLAKLNSKIALQIAMPAHLQALQGSLAKIPEIRKEIHLLQSEFNREIHTGLDALPEVGGLIGRAIADDPAANLAEGNYIRDGYNQELDELRAIRRNAREIIAAMERSERDTTAIPSLKIRYNKVFGYYIEVTNPHLKLIPPHYIRKQTMVNAERFITAELKELEDKILKAEERIVELEKTLYGALIAEIQRYADRLNRNADLIALLDVLAAGGELAQRRNYCRPEVNGGQALRILEGRHPVLEVNSGEPFIPNDLQLSSDSEQILLITGPNMGGKSTYLRQTALLVILAQAGYFVPAEKAQIGAVDRIFTRIGASDSLLEGKSTFLTEMIETAIILNNATSRSLILLDEIGRGTSTFDGLSIAWAVIEYLHGLKERPKTLFATHYHELTELSEILERVQNCHITVREWQENVVFLHKIVPGATDQSFGIHVAKIAGIPAAVIERAKEVLLNLEKKELNRLVTERLTGQLPAAKPKQKSLFPEDLELQVWDEIRKTLKTLDISRITPLEAMNILSFLQRKSESIR